VLRWYAGEEAHDCSHEFELVALNQVEYCAFLVVDKRDFFLTLTLTTLEGNHVGAALEIPLTSFSQNEDFQRMNIDLLNQSGVYASCDVHSACQKRWGAEPVNYGPEPRFIRPLYPDGIADEQAWYLMQHVAPDAAQREAHRVSRRAPSTTGPGASSKGGQREALGLEASKEDGGKSTPSFSPSEDSLQELELENVATEIRELAEKQKKQEDEEEDEEEEREDEEEDEEEERRREREEEDKRKKEEEEKDRIEEELRQEKKKRQEEEREKKREEEEREKKREEEEELEKKQKEEDEEREKKKLEEEEEREKKKLEEEEEREREKCIEEEEKEKEKSPRGSSSHPPRASSSPDSSPKRHRESKKKKNSHRESLKRVKMKNHGKDDVPESPSASSSARGEDDDAFNVHQKRSPIDRAHDAQKTREAGEHWHRLSLEDRRRVLEEEEKQHQQQQQQKSKGKMEEENALVEVEDEDEAALLVAIGEGMGTGATTSRHQTPRPYGSNITNVQQQLLPRGSLEMSQEAIFLDNQRQRADEIRRIEDRVRDEMEIRRRVEQEMERKEKVMLECRMREEEEAKGRNQGGDLKKSGGERRIIMEELGQGGCEGRNTAEILLSDHPPSARATATLRSSSTTKSTRMRRDRSTIDESLNFPRSPSASSTSSPLPGGKSQDRIFDSRWTNNTNKSREKMDFFLDAWENEDFVDPADLKRLSHARHNLFSIAQQVENEKRVLDEEKRLLEEEVRRIQQTRRYLRSGSTEETIAGGVVALDGAKSRLLSTRSRKKVVRLSDKLKQRTSADVADEAEEYDVPLEDEPQSPIRSPPKRHINVGALGEVAHELTEQSSLIRSAPGTRHISPSLSDPACKDLNRRMRGLGNGNICVPHEEFEALCQVSNRLHDVADRSKLEHQSFQPNSKQLGSTDDDSILEQDTSEEMVFEDGRRSGRTTDTVGSLLKPGLKGAKRIHGSERSGPRSRVRGNLWGPSSQSSIQPPLKVLNEEQLESDLEDLGDFATPMGDTAEPSGGFSAAPGLRAKDIMKRFQDIRRQSSEKRQFEGGLKVRSREGDEVLPMRSTIALDERSEKSLNRLLKIRRQWGNGKPSTSAVSAIVETLDMCLNKIKDQDYGDVDNTSLVRYPRAHIEDLLGLREKFASLLPKTKNFGPAAPPDTVEGLNLASRHSGPKDPSPGTFLLMPPTLNVENTDATPRTPSPPISAGRLYSNLPSARDPLALARGGDVSALASIPQHHSLASVGTAFGGQPVTNTSEQWNSRPVRSLLPGPPHIDGIKPASPLSRSNVVPPSLFSQSDQDLGPSAPPFSRTLLELGHTVPTPTLLSAAAPSSLTGGLRVDSVELTPSVAAKAVIRHSLAGRAAHREASRERQQARQMQESGNEDEEDEEEKNTPSTRYPTAITPRMSRMAYEVALGELASDGESDGEHNALAGEPASKKDTQITSKEGSPERNGFKGSNNNSLIGYGEKISHAMVALKKPSHHAYLRPRSEMVSSGMESPESIRSPEVGATLNPIAEGTPSTTSDQFGSQAPAADARKMMSTDAAEGLKAAYEEAHSSSSRSPNPRPPNNVRSSSFSGAWSVGKVNVHQKETEEKRIPPFSTFGSSRAEARLNNKKPSSGGFLKKQWFPPSSLNPRGGYSTLSSGSTTTSSCVEQGRGGQNTGALNTAGGARAGGDDGGHHRSRDEKLTPREQEDKYLKILQKLENSPLFKKGLHVYGYRQDSVLLTMQGKNPK